MANSEPRPWRHKVSGEIKWQGDDFVSREHWERVELDITTGGWVLVDAEKAVEDEKLAPAPIKGYRQLSALELELVNKVKAHAEKTRELIESLELYHNEHALSTGVELDHRWVAIAKTNLQQGYMALVRSITRPETF